MEGGDEVFIINSAEEVQAEEAQVAPSVENTREAEAEALENAKGLVPLCVQHVRGPELSTAVFGYDIAQMVKRPWAEPGVKLSDYFNYGFNEQSWRVYCAMQRNGEESLLAKATEMLQKLEATGRPAVGAEAEAGVAAADPSMHAPMMGGGGGMEGYNANPYGGGYGGEMAGRGGYGGGRPFNNVHQQQQPPRDFHGGMGGGGGDVRGHNANYKTRICKSFAEGHCNRGESCNYAHGVAELRQPGGGVTPFQQGGPQMMGGAPMQQQQQQEQQQQQQPSGHGYGAAAFYPTGSAPPPPERTTNYLMPPGQAGGGNPMPPMMQPNMMMSHEGEGSGGFRQPPKRQRHEGGGGGGVYEPQY